MIEDFALSKLLEEVETIAVITGAGLSTDSGIPDFKTTNAEWAYELTRADVMSHWFFQTNPFRFWEIYRDIYSEKLLDSIMPNRNHKWLANLENDYEVTIITQNVDGLHQAAGSTDVLEVHGNLRELQCVACLKSYPAQDYKELLLPRCENCHKPLKPQVSLFGEGVSHFGEARDVSIEADLLIVMGTSLEVGPINEIPFYSMRNETQKRLWANGTPPPSDYDDVFTHGFVGEFKDFLSLHNIS